MQVKGYAEDLSWLQTGTVPQDRGSMAAGMGQCVALTTMAASHMAPARKQVVALESVGQATALQGLPAVTSC